MEIMPRLLRIPEEEKTPLLISLGLHGTVVLIALGIWLVSLFRQEPDEIFVFEMVDLQQLEAAQTPPQPEPAPAPEPAPEPPPPEPPPPEPAPPPPPAPAPPPPPRVTYDAHRQDNPVRQPPRPRPPPTPRPVEVPSINAREFTESIRRTAAAPPAVVQRDAAMSGAQINELARYGARLSALAHQQWTAPSGSLRESVDIEFQVNAQGLVLSARVLRSSGVPAFDQSALQAVQAIQGAGPTPTGRGHSFRITVAMETNR
jgi:protein TonB